MLAKTYNNSLFPILLLLLALSGCGSRSGSAPASNSIQNSKPDSLQIEIDGVGIGATKPVVTLMSGNTMQQLYSATYMLPQMPEGQVCTMEGGPSYKITFLLRNKALGTALAMREGCGAVTITGEQHEREATKEFWTLLDKSIYQATPPAHPTQLSLMRVPPTNQVAQTALVTNIDKIQRFYSAILALPQAGYANGEPTYQLVFHENDLSIPSTIYQKNNLISLEGNYHTRGGWYTMNDQFEHLLAAMLNSTTSAPAHPDQLALNLSVGNKTDQKIGITDTVLIQKLYMKTLKLALARSQQFPGCLGDDKIHGKGAWYYFDFSQWDLPVLEISAYEGCTSFVNNSAQQYLQGDQEFWSLVHSASQQ